MEYLLLFGACLFFASQFIFQKLFERRTTSGLKVCLWNVLVCGIITAIFMFAKTGELPQNVTSAAFLYAFLYSVSGIVCSVASIAAMHCGNVAVISTYCLAGGMVLPYFYGIISLGEDTGIFKWLGIVVLCLSLIPALMVKPEGKEEHSKKDTVWFFILCMLIFLSNGLVSIFSKMHQISPAAIDENYFVFLSAIIRMAIVLAMQFLMAAISRAKGGKDVLRSVFLDIGKCQMTGKLFLWLIVLAGGYAVCNAVGNLFSLRCMMMMDASIQFPVLSAVIIILSAVFGRIIFKEKITKNTGISLALSAVGIALFGLGGVL